MADFVVWERVQKLDRLIPILQKILNLKKLQAKLFTEKVGEVIMLLNVEGAPTLPDQLVEEILHLALPVGDFVRTELGYEMTTCSKWGRKLSIEVPELVGQIGVNEKKLEKFLDSTDFYNDWECLRNNLVLQPCREAVRALLQASCLLKDTMNFVHEFSTELAALRECLRFLLAFTKQCDHPNEWQCHQFVEGISVVTIQALLAVNWSYIDNLEWKMLILEDDRRGIRHPAVETDRIYSDGKNGKRLVFLDTLGMLHSFKEEIDTTLGKLGRKDLQSQNAAFGGNDFPSPSMICEKFAREDLPSLPVRYNQWADGIK